MKPIEKMTLSECPALMTTITVIQALQEKLKIDGPFRFKDLEPMTGSTLFQLRDKLIHLYHSMTYVNTFKN